MTTYRPMILDDYDEVYALWQSLPGIGLSSADSRENIARYLQVNPGFSFVAYGGGSLVGAVLCGHDSRRGYLHHLAVHPNFQRQGIGKVLVDHCLKALQKAGIHKVHIFVIAGNEDGLLFWQKNGWRKRDDIFVMSYEKK